MFAALTAGQFAGRRTYKKGRTDRRCHGRNYGWRQRADGREFCGGATKLGRSMITQHRGAALGGRYGRARRTKFRGRATKFPSSRPRKFRGAQIWPRNRIYSRIPRSLLVIRPVIAAALGARYGRARRTEFRGRATKFPSSRPRK